MFVFDLFEKKKQVSAYGRFVGGTSQDARVKNALDNAYRAVPAAKSPEEAALGYIDIQNSLNQKQDQVLSQQNKTNQQQTGQITGLVNDMRRKEQDFRNLNAKIASMPNVTPQQVAKMAQDIEVAHSSDKGEPVDVSNVIAQRSAEQPAAQPARAVAAPGPGASVSQLANYQKAKDQGVATAKPPPATPQTKPAPAKPADKPQVFSNMAGQLNVLPSQQYTAKATAGDTIKKNAAAGLDYKIPPGPAGPADNVNVLDPDAIALLTKDQEKTPMTELAYREGDPNQGSLNWTALRLAWKARSPSVWWQFGSEKSLKLYQPQMYALLQVWGHLPNAVEQEDAIQNSFSVRQRVNNLLNDNVTKQYIALYAQWQQDQVEQQQGQAQQSLLQPTGEPAVGVQPDPEQAELFRENAWHNGQNSWSSEHDQWTKESVEETRLTVGDPVVVTAPNEYQGKTGEISEFSPSGKFVIVNLYNYGEHSMHLSDVAYNEYAEQDKKDDWYDESVAEKVEEATGDRPFDSMMTTIKKGAAKQATQDRRAKKKKNQQRARAAFDNMFGGGNPADKLANKEPGVAEGLPQTLRKVVPGYAKREIDKKMDAEKFGRTDVDRDANYYRYKKIQDKIKDKGIAEGHADQQRKVFKKNGEPVGEVGIDRESSPGNGQWYMKCYAYDIDNSGYDSYEEAVAELKHCMKQGVAEDTDSWFRVTVKTPNGKNHNIQVPANSHGTAKRKALAYCAKNGIAGAEFVSAMRMPTLDEPGVAEGFQDFNKVEPYAVCLAGKPVKKFDYYEDARRFHDNWKQKLYREGNKTKADKITLMPLNLDEDVKTIQGPHGRLDVDTDTPGITKVRQKDRLGAKTFIKDPYRVGGSRIGQKSPDISRGSSLTSPGAYNINPGGRTFPRLDYSDGDQLVYYSAESVEEAETDYTKRRDRERKVDAGQPVSRQPKNPQTDYAKKRAKDKRDMELGESTNYWTRLQNERNTKVASLVNELTESVKDIK